MEVEALRSLFAVPEPTGALGEAGGAIAIRVDGLPIKELNRIAGLYDLAELDASRTYSRAGSTGSRSIPRQGSTTSCSPAGTSATAPGRSSSRRAPRRRAAFSDRRPG